MGLGCDVAASKITSPSSRNLFIFFSSSNEPIEQLNSFHKICSDAVNNVLFIGVARSSSAPNYKADLNAINAIININD